MKKGFILKGLNIIISVIGLVVYVAIVNLRDASGRLNSYGYIFIVIGIIAFIVNILVEYKKHREEYASKKEAKESQTIALKTQNDIEEIKEALKSKGWEFDKVENKIVPLKGQTSGASNVAGKFSDANNL